MAFLGPIPLTETSPGVYETWWTVPLDFPSGVYDVVGVLVVAGEQKAPTPPAVLIVLPLPPPPTPAAPAAEVPPVPPPPTPAAPAAEVPPVPTPPTPAAPVPAFPPPPRSPGGPFPGTALGGPVQVGGAIRVTPDDLLIIGVRNVQSGVQVVLSARLWTDAGDWSASSKTVTPPTDRSLTYYAMPLTWGYLVAAAAVALAAGTLPVRGQTLVSIRLARGSVASFTTTALLAQDYLTGQGGPAWPPGQIVPGLSGMGFINEVVVNNPAVGAEWNMLFPTGARTRLITLQAQLTTNAVVGNRTPVLDVEGPGGDLYEVIAAFPTPANTTTRYTWWPGSDTARQAGGNKANEFFPPNLALEDQWAIVTTTIGKTGGDQWSGIFAWVEQWLND